MTAPALTVGELRSRVASGAAWLDLHHPDWWRTDRPDQGGSWEGGGPVDPDALVMSHPCYCVLGQLLGDFYRADLTLDDAIRYGFDAGTGDGCQGDHDDWWARLDEEFDALTQLWRQTIEQRRAEVSRG